MRRAWPGASTLLRPSKPRGGRSHLSLPSRCRHRVGRGKSPMCRNMVHAVAWICALLGNSEAFAVDVTVQCIVVENHRLHLRITNRDTQRAYCNYNCSANRADGGRGPHFCASSILVHAGKEQSRLSGAGPIPLDDKSLSLSFTCAFERIEIPRLNCPARDLPVVPYLPKSNR
jgi:hypothetical protein